jgi:hypothetical protein
MPLIPVPLFGSGVAGKSFVVTRQRRVNTYYETRADGDKAKVVVYGTPGLQLAFTVNGLTRALFGPTESTLYAIVGNQFQSLSAPATPGALANVLYAAGIGTASGLASMASNPAASQIVTVDGSSGYVFSGGVLAPLTAAWFVPGAQTVTNVGGYFVTEIAGTAQFAVSNLNDATAGSALSFASFAAFPDVVAAVDNLGGNLIGFCQQHIEFWQATGTPPPSQPFAPIQSATTQIGLAAVFSRAHIDNALVFLGETTAGTRRVYRMDGYTMAPISEEIDYIINQPGFVFQDAVALAYQRDKHPFYQLTFPTMNRSFLFDLSTNIPSEAQSGITTATPIRHTANLSSYYAGDTLLTDYASGNIYRMVDTQYTDNGTPVLREIITKHHVKGFNRFRVPQLYIDMETGVGTSSGQGLNPMLSIECSKDNGRTWLEARLIPMGPQGQYIARINARRFGMSRVFTWRIRCTDPVKFVIVDAAIRTKMKKAA